MKKILYGIILILSLTSLFGCQQLGQPTAQDVEQAQQEKSARDAASSIGFPAIKNYREKRLLKQILEMRDQEGLRTWTYIKSEMTGKLVLLGESIGYGIPAATQYTNPQKIEEKGHQYGYAILPQADPNQLYSPSSADATWVLVVNPRNPKEVKPVYVEEKIVVSPFPLQ